MPKCAKDHHRGELFKVLVIVDAQLSEFFNQDDLLTLQKLEETLLSNCYTEPHAVVGEEQSVFIILYFRWSNCYIEFQTE